MSTNRDTHHGEDEQAIKAARAELDPQERQLVDAQDYCPIMTENRLGTMGKPFKVMIKDQPVYLCCKGCRTRALANAEQTLAKVAELKARPRTTARE